MKKNVRARQRKYKSRKKYVIPMIVLSVLLVISVMGVYAAIGDVFTDASTGLKYEILTEDTTTKTGTVKIVGYEPPASTSSTLEIPAKVSYTPSGETTPFEYNITEIGSSTSGLSSTGAFEGNTALTKVSMASGSAITAIDANAFKGCTVLDTIDFTNATELKTLGKGAFAECSKLKTVDVSNTKLETIPSEAFKNCHVLSSILFPDSLNTISDDAFSSCALLTTVHNLPKDTEIAVGAFYGCCYLNKDVFNDMKSAPDPFDESKVISDLIFNTRGTTVTKVTAAVSGGPTGSPDVPARLFNGQKYNVWLRTPNSYELSGLDLR